MRRWIGSRFIYGATGRLAITNHAETDGPDQSTA